MYIRLHTYIHVVIYTCTHIYIDIHIHAAYIHVGVAVVAGCWPADRPTDRASISKSLGMLCLAAQNEQSILQCRPHQVSLPWHHLGVQHLSYFSQADNICQRQASSHVASCCLTSMGASVVVQVCFVHLRAVRASCGLGSTFNCCHIARLLETDLGSG